MKELSIETETKLSNLIKQYQALLIFMMTDFPECYSAYLKRLVTPDGGIFEVTMEKGK